MPDQNNYTDWLKIVAQLNNTLPGLAASGSYQLTSDGRLVPLTPPQEIDGSALTPIEGNYNLPDHFPARAAPPYTSQSAYLSLIGNYLTGTGQFQSDSNSHANISLRLEDIYTGKPNSSGVFESYLNFRNFVTGSLDAADVAVWESGLQQDFDFLNGLDPTHATLGGWSDLAIFPPEDGNSNNSILINPDGSTLTDIFGDPITNPAQLAQLAMANTFNYFLRHYNFPANPLFGEPARQIAMDWQRFLVSRGTIEDSSASQLAAFPDFKEVFDAFNPGATATEYQEKLVSFYREMVDRDGYFLPSHQLKDWVAEVQKTALVSIGAVSSISGTGSSKTLVLLRLFALLVEMIEQLQRVTAAQAERLKFYASYQKAYTELLAQIPVINVHNISQRVAADAKGESEVSQAVQQFTSQWTEIQRGYRSVVGDESKEHQTAVNQSNEIVNQQAQLGTSILQQMSTILTTIFK